MTIPLKTRPGFKAIAIAVAFSFLWQQISWAADIAAGSLESSIERLNSEQSQTFAPSYLQDQQAIHESIISQKQLVEDLIILQNSAPSAPVTAPAETEINLQGPRGGDPAAAVQSSQPAILEEGAPAPASDSAVLSVTTQEGDIVYYAGGAIDHIIRKDGTVLRGLVMDQSNNLLAADILYTDGTTQIVDNGKLVKAIRPDDTIVNYNTEERVSSVGYPDGAAVTYTYIKDTAGNVTETVLTNSNGTVSHYDASGKLSKVTKPDGTITEYAAGILSKMTKPDGKVFQFKAEVVAVTVGLQPAGPTADELAIQAQILEIQSLFYTDPAEFARRTQELHDLCESQYSYKDNNSTTTVSTGEVRVTLSQYIDEIGNIYDYMNGAVTSVSVRQNNAFYQGSVDSTGSFTAGTITLADGTKVFVTQGTVTSATFADGAIANYINPTPGLIIVDVIKNGQLTHYELNGDNQLFRDQAFTVYSYTKELITKKVTSSGAVTNYIREVDLQGDPSRVTVLAPGQAGGVYLYNKDTGILTKETIGMLNVSYFSAAPAQITISNTPTGVAVTDGTYFYIQKYDTVLRTDTFIKAGTGLNGTVAGKIYGTIAASSSGLSAAYYSDGFIYKATASPYVLEKINVNTGARSTVNISAGLIDFTKLPPAAKALMTSDGRYVYNVANYVGSGMFNGWTIRVFDPQNNWRLVRTYTVGTVSYSTSGIMSDGICLYFIDQGSGRITASRLSDGAITTTYNRPSAITGVMNCQYDWINNKFWFGSSAGTKMYSYSGLIQKVSPGSIDTDGLFTPTAKFKQIKDILNCPLKIAIPLADFLNSAISYRELVYGADSALLSAIKYDGTKFVFTNGAVSSVTDANGSAVNYSYDYSELDTVLDVNVTRDGIKRFYDIKGELRSITTSDNTTVAYNGNTVSSVAYADGTTLLYFGGRIDEAIDKDGTRFTLDVNGRPISAVDRYGNVYRYSYSTDISGKAVTMIEDLSRSEARRYEDGVLIRTEGSDGSVSENIYYADERLKEARVTRLGRIINIYIYTYNADGTTAVSDIDGNIRTYGADGKLAALTDAIGSVYQYSYPDSVTTRMELIRYDGPQGVDDLVIAQDFVNNVLRRVYRANDTVTDYTPDGKIDYISNFENDILVDYQYEDDGNLTAIVMADARRDLERSVEDARNNIEEQRAQALAQLAAQRGIVVDQINNQVAPDMNNLIAERNSLRSQWNNLNGQDVGWDPFGNKRREKSRALDALGSAIVQVESALSQVYAQLADAYAEVDSEVAALKAQIDVEAEASLAQVKAKEDELEFNISKQEAASFVLYCYRTTLGRDPDQAEADNWIAKLSPGRQRIDRSEIIESILASTEYNTLKENVARIKQDIRTIIGSYLNIGSAAEKTAFLSALGLTQNDIVTLTGDDADNILSWIDSQGMHFGQSAFYALENILKASGVDSNIEELAVTAIMIDILVGAIDVFTKGDLEISMYALSKFAEIKGVSLYNTKLTFDDLAALQTLGSQSRAIAHIDGNHYIVVTGIEGDIIRYREENKGSSGTSEVMSKSDFLKRWSGYTITKIIPQDTAKIISASQARKVHGAFFAFLIPLIGAIIGAISGVVAGIISAVTTIVAGVIGVVSTALANVAGFIATAGTQLIGGISAAFSGIGQMVGVLAGSSFFGTAVNAIVGIGLSAGIQTGLEAMGVNSTISGLTGAFLTGGVLGLLNPVKGVSMLGSFMSGALKYATVAGINELAPRLNLNSSISGILSIIAGALIDGFWQGDIAGKLVKIAPNIASECAYIGVTEIGEMLGVDPRLSYLAGVGIRSTINAGLTHEFMPDVIWGSVQNGLLRGVTNLGLEWVSQRLDIPPIVASLAGAAIVGSLESLLEGGNPIQGIFDTYFKAGVGLLTLGGDGGTDAWLRAAYISQVLDFSRIVQERGIVSALDSYAAGFLNQTTINEIWKEGGIADLVANNAEVVENGEGQTVKRVWVDKNNKEISAYIDLDIHTDNLRGFKQIFSDGGYEIADCDYVVGPDGKPMAKNEIRTRYDASGNPIMRAVTQLFNLVKVEIFGNTGLITGEITPLDDKTGIGLDSNGDPTNAKIKSYQYDEEILIKDGVEQQRISKGLNRFSLEDRQSILADLNLTEDDASNIMITETRDANGKVAVGLTYNQADRPEKIGASDWFDIALSEDGKERIYNANHFFAYRTNAEIAASRQAKIGIMMTNYRVGDTLIINGRGFSADTIKIVTNGPANHTSMVFIDDIGDEWIMEMPGPLWCSDEGNLRFTKVSAYAEHLNEIDCDLEIGRRNDMTAEDLTRMSSIIGDLFYNKGRTVREIKNSNGEVVTIIKDVPYNTANVFAISGDTKRTFTCSSLIDYVYEETGKPLVDKPQLQVSPVDIRNSFEEKGELR